MDKRTAFAHFANLLAEAATAATTARNDIQRGDRIDALDSIDVAAKRLAQARAEIAATLPFEVRPS